jgi:hypothetical protein
VILTPVEAIVWIVAQRQFEVNFYGECLRYCLVIDAFVDGKITDLGKLEQFNLCKKNVHLEKVQA